MDKRDVDKFESTKQNIFAEEIGQKDNFFLNNNSKSFKNNLLSSIPTRRLNDYDYNLLQEDAYKDINDELFKLEYKISKIEDELKVLETQIQTAIEINDSRLQERLFSHKYSLEQELGQLFNTYNEKSLSAKITESITSKFNNTIKFGVNNINNRLKALSQKFLAYLPKSLASNFELKQSLNKLENINKSVDELISNDIPYGEMSDKYEQLSKYIIRANSIQAKLAKHKK